MADNLDLRDEDRLPWLETVEPDETRGPGAGRVFAWVLLGLVLIAGVVFAGLHLTHRGAAAGNGDLIASQGDYKVKPDDPGGLKVGGEGDQAIATSTGAAPGGGRIDLRQVPEAPVQARHTPASKPTPTPAAGSRTVAAVPASGGRLTVTPPVSAPKAGVPGATSGGSLVQLGAFPTEASANAAWSALARRFSYLATLGKEVQQAQVNGRTVYRLRVNAGSAGAASDLCGRLKVAGESCFVTAG